MLQSIWKEEPTNCHLYNLVIFLNSNFMRWMKLWWCWCACVNPIMNWSHSMAPLEPVCIPFQLDVNIQITHHRRTAARKCVCVYDVLMRVSPQPPYRFSGLGRTWFEPGSEGLVPFSILLLLVAYRLLTTTISWFWAAAPVFGLGFFFLFFRGWHKAKFSHSFRRPTSMSGE